MSFTCRNSFIFVLHTLLPCQLPLIFLNTIPTCLGDISIFPFGCLSLLPLPICFIFLCLMSVWNSLFKQAGFLSCLFACKSRYGSWALKWLALTIRTLLCPAVLQSSFPKEPVYSLTEQAEVYFPRFLGL